MSSHVAMDRATQRSNFQAPRILRRCFCPRASHAKQFCSFTISDVKTAILDSLNRELADFYIRNYNGVNPELVMAVQRFCQLPMTGHIERRFKTPRNTIFGWKKRTRKTSEVGSDDDTFDEVGEGDELTRPHVECDSDETAPNKRHCV